MADIAAFYGVPAADLERWNEADSESLAAGAKLTVYLPEAAQPAQEPETPDPKKTAPTKVASAPKDETGDAEPPQTGTKDKPAADAETLREIAYKLVHTVETGDTLAGLAERYDVAAEDITIWNGLEGGDLEAGQRLTIFVGAETKAEQTAAAAAEDAAASEAKAKADSEPAQEGGQEDAPAPSESEPIETEIYVVQSGDTLNKVSREYNAPKALILELNGIDDPNHIWVGQRLKVPAKASAPN